MPRKVEPVLTGARRVLVAPDKFKGSLTASNAASAIAEGLRRVAPDTVVVQRPMADGGEGTVDLALRAGFAPVHCKVRGPLGDPVSVTYAVLGHTAILEAATACGLALLPLPPDDRTAATASTYGVGELVRNALDLGMRHIVLGVGGTATTDGGAGAAQALGVRLTDSGGEDLRPGGLALASLDSLKLSDSNPQLADVEIVVACDVDNPLLGPAGAATTYAAQKGASPATTQQLESALTRWADKLGAVVGRDHRATPGAGAGGGLGFAALALLGARVRPGVEVLGELTGLEEAISDADLVVVGEGSFDEQSLRGKGPVGVALMARRLGVPTVALVGRSLLGGDRLAATGVCAVHALTDLADDETESMTRAGELLMLSAQEVAERWLSPSPQSTTN